MSTGVIILLICIAVLVISGFAVMLCVTYPISKDVYREQLVKTSSDKWGRVCSAPENEEQLQMWNSGIAWAEENKAYAKEVSVKNGDLTLYGEYYDFGHDTCAIILPGRCESLMYSYYFAKPYQDAGKNVLVIDSRCHGKSDGVYSTIGVYEATDVKCWIEYMQKAFCLKGFWLHGICIGSAAALIMSAAEDSPTCVDGIVLEGCFVGFRESFKEHMREKKKPLFPVLDLVMLHICFCAKANVYTKTPLKAVKKIHVPILFLFGKQDIFSLPAKSQKLFDACASAHKKLVWFDKGGHSHLRINNTEQYDTVIKEFVNAYAE